MIKTASVPAGLISFVQTIGVSWNFEAAFQFFPHSVSVADEKPDRTIVHPLALLFYLPVWVTFRVAF